MAFGVKTNERPGTRAELKYARFSAFKAREVLNIIRGRSVAEAQAILDLTERGAAEPILKLLNSAIANAEHNDGIGRDELYVSACFADEGPTLKRFRPRARGRAGRINKRTCHVTIIVSRYAPEELELRRAQDARRGAAPGAAASRARRVAGSRKSGESAKATDAPADEAVTDDVVTDEVVTDEAVAPLYNPADAGDAAGDDAAPNATDGPYGAGSHAPLDDPAEMPEGFPIKGNADSMLFHPPESPFYGRTVAEVWFDTAESAEAAGFSLPPSMADDAADDSDEGEK